MRFQRPLLNFRGGRAAPPPPHTPARPLGQLQVANKNLLARNLQEGPGSPNAPPRWSGPRGPSQEGVRAEAGPHAPVHPPGPRRHRRAGSPPSHAEQKAAGARVCRRRPRRAVGAGGAEPKPGRPGGGPGSFTRGPFPEFLQGARAGLSQGRGIRFGSAGKGAPGVGGGGKCSGRTAPAVPRRRGRGEGLREALGPGRRQGAPPNSKATKGALPERACVSPCSVRGTQPRRRSGSSREAADPTGAAGCVLRAGRGRLRGAGPGAREPWRGEGFALPRSRSGPRAPQAPAHLRSSRPAWVHGGGSR